MDFPYTFSSQELAWIQAASAFIALLAFLLSVLAVYFTARTYWQKRGAFVRGSYVITSSSIATDNKFVHNVLLENLKDRAIVIFGIYLHLSNGYLVEVESFENSPLVLKPFEVVKRTYDPVDFYSFNARRINLNALFDHRYRKNPIVLATSDGKLVVRKSIPTWNPIFDWFKNHLRITAKPQRTFFHGKAYGSNVLFLIDLFEKGERVQSIPLHPQEFSYRWFRELGGNTETLNSVENVTAIFEAAIKEGKIKADRVEVLDVQKALESSYKEFSKETFVAENNTWLFVSVIGRLATWKSNRDIRRRNQEANKGQVQKVEPKQEATKE